ncbi:MAG: hypothetical protein ACREQJ_12450, partial [Candidatus Binatia bacterium]
MTRSAALTLLLLGSVLPPHLAAEELPLLDLDPIRSPFAKACEGQPDETPMPDDPRKLVAPGINAPGAAVQFNA